MHACSFRLDLVTVLVELALARYTVGGSNIRQAGVLNTAKADLSSYFLVGTKTAVHLEQ